MVGNVKIRDAIIKRRDFMATPVQYVWSASSGLYLVPLNGETTSKPFTPVDTTGGKITYANFPRQPEPPIVSREEHEWASLLASERKSLARRRIKPRAVAKAIKELRYRR
jgi:hypothetical protein